MLLDFFGFAVRRGEPPDRIIIAAISKFSISSPMPFNLRPFFDDH